MKQQQQQEDGGGGPQSTKTGPVSLSLSLSVCLCVSRCVCLSVSLCLSQVLSVVAVESSDISVLFFFFQVWGVKMYRGYPFDPIRTRERRERERAKNHWMTNGSIIPNGSECDSFRQFFAAAKTPTRKMAKAQNQGKSTLWASILANVASKTTTRHLPSKNVVVLGDEGTGKSSFISRLQGNQKYDPKDHPMGTGLEYTYLDVRDEETEDVVGRLGVYTLDGNIEHAPLLDFVITPESISDLVFVIVVDMTKPWDIMRGLKRWLGVIEEYTASLYRSSTTSAPAGTDDSAVPVDGEGAVTGGDADATDAATTSARQELDAREAVAKQLTEMREKLARYVQDPTLAENTLLELEDGVLTTNLGVPIVFVVNKSDAMAALRKDRDYQGQHFDFIQLHVRRLALAYGAATVYSCKDASNNTAVHRYLVHRAYVGDDLTRHRFPFRAEDASNDPETFFMPSGVDSAAKIQVLEDGLKTISANDEYEEQIFPPPTSEEKEVLIEVKDEQEFLKEQQAVLGKTQLSAGVGRRQNLSLDPRRNKDTKVTMSTLKTGSLGAAPAPSGGGASAVTSAPTTSAGPVAATPAAATAAPKLSAPKPSAGLSAGDKPASAATPALSGMPGGVGADGKANNDMLASFFSNLLSKSNSTAAGGAGAAKK
ncbi:uncharacterized protein MONBRDRAFT_31584 [Monosiga brevicollis MX1]|uniref:Dynein light intermediate chain n=1 Tax=Monosiga brevicollis TaxID=81824 RepID=A9UU61_MONBE|nr:uncharacterized protein MONBRDRAFT_31584 [Monosiga brevicollis MX1]EDQ91366.1 predicted protein [Monosiga brevicollis MX1]|eukprot:XP_001743788.1 hypothetical protein [Monosiga brevicollis MX1]